MSNYGDFENYIREIFENEQYFIFQGDKYKILFTGKPKTQGRGGEPKTDVFVRTENSEKYMDFKISVKLHTASYFLENKIKNDRLHEIFGDERIEFIKNEFSKLINELNYEKFENDLSEKKYLLGLKCEILKNDTRKKRIRIKATKDETYEIYSGSKRPDEYKNAIVDDKEIVNSGVAEYIIVSDLEEIKTIKDISDKLITIDEYVENNENCEIDICFTGLNIFPLQAYKFDGDRPLFAFYEWHYKDGKMIGNINYEKPLSQSANDIADRFKMIHSKHL